jgi:hypothetical protein
MAAVVAVDVNVRLPIQEDWAAAAQAVSEQAAQEAMERPIQAAAAAAAEQT